MASTKVDTKLVVHSSNELNSLIGAQSRFSEEPHPATGKTIDGWRWDERTWPDEKNDNAIENIPNLWDPETENLGFNDFQAGIGDSYDGKVVSIRSIVPSGGNTWSPEVAHGYYYDQDTEGYLFSDDSVFEIFPSGQTHSGVNYLDLSFDPKPGIPIFVTKWEWDSENFVYNYAERLKKVADFTGKVNSSTDVREDTRDSNGNILWNNIDTTFSEFVIDYDADPLRAYTNSGYIETHGSVSDPEIVGTSDGTADAEYHTTYSPVTSGSATILTSSGTSGPWSSLTLVDEPTASGEVGFDYDLGIVTFGDWVPPSGHTVGATYDSTLAIEYERIHSRDTVTAFETNSNPLSKGFKDGFIALRREELAPAEITLEVNPIPQISENFYGPAFAGNNTVPLKATVKSASGEVIPNIEVTFEQLNSIGDFSGGASSAIASTDGTGIARTDLNTPKDVSDLGIFTDDVQQDMPASGQTQVTTSGVDLAGESQFWYLYKVFTDDPLLGLDDVDQYYTDYFSEEDIVGPTTSGEWEDTHRTLVDLLTPTEYNTALNNGRRKVVTTWSDDAINPHTFQDGAFVPLRPTDYSKNSDGTIDITYSGLLELPTSSGINDRLDGYFVSGPAVAEVQASVYNEKTGKTITSNKVSVEIKAPPHMDGTVLIETLNEAEKDDIFAGVASPPASGVLPLGFRFKSSGSTLASALNGLTYFDINPEDNVLTHTYTITDEES